MESKSMTTNSNSCFVKIFNKNTKNYNLSDSPANSERIHLGCFFFDLVKDLSIDIRIKENCLRLYDRLKDMDEFDPIYKRIFLLATLQISLKLFEPSHIKIMIKVIESFNNLKKFLPKPGRDLSEDSVNTSQINLDVTFEEINMVEMYILNILNWKFNLVLFTDIVLHFINNNLQEIFTQIEKDPLMEFIYLLIESALTAFNTDLTCIFAIAICIILIAIDQFNNLPCNHAKIINIVNNFFESVFL